MSPRIPSLGISSVPIQAVTEEFIGLSHPRNKLHKPTKSEIEKKRRGRPATHGLSKHPIYISHREAMRRCRNAKHPDFANYGGRGIKYLFDSVTDLLAAIGPKPSGCTLDRIDPNGHYVAGNVRWATPKEQANNRRPAADYRAIARDRSWYRAGEDRKEYKIVAKHWMLSIRCMNDPKDLTPSETSFLEEQHRATGVPKATFWENAEGESHYVKLPVLNCSGSCVVRVGQLVRSQHSALSERGLLEGTGDIPLTANCAAEEVDIINSFVRGYQSRRGASGIIYSGQLKYNNNRIEGRLLATAGRLMSLQRASRIMLAGEVAAHLSINNTSSLLTADYLFLPDLNVWSEVFGSDRLLTHRLSEVLMEREQQRLPTLAYVENPITLGPRFASLFEHRYIIGNLSKVRNFNHPYEG